MAVKLELYRVFKEVAESGNISVAAKNLYISQSAVSQSIKQLETALQAGSVAARVGAGMCCLISVLVVWAADTMLYSPWIIYFSILGTHYLVKWRKTKKKTDLIITTLYFAMLALFSVFFALRLVEVVG